MSREDESGTGIDYWTNHTRFHGIASTISGFFISDGFQAENLPHEVIVDKLYRSILGREGGCDENLSCLERLGRGDAIQSIIKDFVAGAEYREKEQAGAVPPSNMSVYPSTHFC
jgi:hypothetical protein